MTADKNKNFYRLDDFEATSFPTKSQILDFAENQKITLFIKCINQRGLVFSVVDGVAIGHREATYSGHLLLSLEASSKICHKGAHLITSGKIVELEKVLLDESHPKQSPNYLIEKWEPIENLKNGIEYGLYLNVSLGETLESAFEIDIKAREIHRQHQPTSEPLDPFSEKRGVLRDCNLLGQTYTTTQVRVDNITIDEIKKSLSPEQKSTKALYRKTDFTKLLVRVLKDNIHATASEIYQILEAELDYKNKKYDVDHILVKRKDDAIQWENKKGKATWVRFATFDQRVSRIRGLEGLNKK